MLVMIESRAWGETSGMASETFILDGGLARHSPETRGQPVDIQLTCSSTPRGPFAEIIDHGTAQLNRLGIGFRVSVRASPEGSA